MLGNLITISKFDASSIAANAQNEALEQLAKAREAKADNYAKQTQDNFQKAKAPNQIDAVIGIHRVRQPFSQDIIDVKDVTSEALADSFASASLKQEAEAQKPISEEPAYELGSAENEGRQRGSNDQLVNSHNNVRAQIDQPETYMFMGAPIAEIYVDKITSSGTGINVELQDLIQNAKVGKNSAVDDDSLPGGDAQNDADQITGSTQDIDSQNRIDVTENIAGDMPRPSGNPDPSVRRLTSTGLGDNVQAQSAAQTALTEARSITGANAGNTNLERATSTQDVKSGNIVNMLINDRVNPYELAIADNYSSTSTGSNLQDQLNTQVAETTYRGAASNSGEQGQWSSQDVGSGNWLNVQM